MIEFLRCYKCDILIGCILKSDIARWEGNNCSHCKSADKHCEVYEQTKSNTCFSKCENCVLDDI